MARPPIELDEDIIIKLAAIHCTMDEIAHICGCCKDVIERRPELMAKIYKAKAEGKSSLRRHQWKLAQAGNPTMLIWLGKQLLDQKDVSRIELDKVPQDMLVAEVKRRLKVVRD